MIYALLVAGLSLAGAAIPLWTRPGHAQLQIYLSLAAGALLGAALFHLLPESGHFIPHAFGLPAVLGVMIVFFLQRYLAPHSHEISPELPPGSPETPATLAGPVQAAAEPHDHAGHVHPPHQAVSEPGHDTLLHERARGAGPFLTGMVAILALSIHSLFDGIAIGAASAPTAAGGSLVLSVFLSVLIHKPLDGLSVSVLLLQAGVRRSRLWMVQIVYAALVPLGALGFQFVAQSFDDASVVVGWTLAFSGGAFLAIALTDLLPELHFHTHDRNKLSAALILGLVVMWLTSLIGHGENGHAHGAANSDGAAGHVDDADGDHHDHDH